MPFASESCRNLAVTIMICIEKHHQLLLDQNCADKSGNCICLLSFVLEPNTISGPKTADK